LGVNTTIADVMRQVREHIVLILQLVDITQTDQAIGLLESSPLVTGVEKGDATLKVILAKGVEEYSDLPATLFETGIRLRQFREEQLDLESAFMALTKGTSQRM
jgi:ABC-2 type transport system ATP-binding protein